MQRICFSYLVKLEYKNKDDVTRFWKMVLNKHTYSTESTSSDDALLKKKRENQASQASQVSQARQVSQVSQASQAN